MKRKVLDMVFLGIFLGSLFAVGWLVNTLSGHRHSYRGQHEHTVADDGE